MYFRFRYTGTAELTDREFRKAEARGDRSCGEGQAGNIWMEIREEDQCRELLCVLYRALETDGGKESVYAAEPPDLQGAMRLTLDLVWFKGEDLISVFQKKIWDRNCPGRILSFDPPEY